MVGRIVRPHGIRGEVIVEPSTDAPARFDAGKTLGAGDPNGAVRSLTVSASRAHQGRFIVAFDDVADRTDAEAMRGALLSIPAGEAEPPAEGRYYAHQLEGLRVVDEHGAELGVMSGVLEYPANDLWVVHARGKDVLVPAVRAIVVGVDLAGGRIVLRPPEGLFE